MKRPPRQDDTAKKRIGLILGPALAIATLLSGGISSPDAIVIRAAAVAILMAVWWITEAIPIPATALLPVALFPVLGILSGKATAATYFNHVIFLFIGGFVMALAMQRWNLHKRIALRIVMALGTGPRQLILGFMVATAFLSMWISNTATTMMMVPIAIAVIMRFRVDAPGSHTRGFATGLMIGIAYAASTGGIATLIGTPPNLSFSRIFAIVYPNGPEIAFADWLFFALPCSVIMLFLAWWLVTRLFVPREFTAGQEKSTLRDEYQSLGKLSYEEKIVGLLFTLMALLWVFRKRISLGGIDIPGWSEVLPAARFIDDGTVAICIAVVLFLWPSKSKPKERLMDWNSAVRLPWGIVILFGGGFALATGFVESGLSLFIAEQLTVLKEVPSVVLIGSTCTVMTFLTELTSNTATTEMVLPLMGSLSHAIQVNPLLLMIPATLAASCAFMLPVATPPNAIVFGSGEVRMSDMIKAGIILNLAGVVVIVAVTFLLGMAVFNIEPGVMPDWAVPAGKPG